jgi:hypothetical protein
MKVLAPETDAYNRAFRPVAELLFPERAQAILDLRPDPGLQDRIQELGAKANEGELTEVEQAEYDGYILANDFIAILRRQAKKSLSA